MNNTEKLLFLNLVKEKKDIIFGKFSDEITRETKLQAWKDIVEQLKVYVKLAADKEVSYFRDTVWPNLKRYTMEKRDKRKKTGESGGSAIRWSETDSAVLNIICADTAAVVGLQTTETWQQESAKENMSPLPTSDTASASGVSGNENTKPKRKSTGDKEDEFMSEFKKKKIMKIDLEIEHLTLKNAWLRNKMEQEMNVVFEGDLYYRL